MGIEYSFYCDTCKTLYETGKATATAVYVPILTELHKGHKWYAVDEDGIRETDNYIMIFPDDDVSYLSFPMPKRIDCLSEEWEGKPSWDEFSKLADEYEEKCAKENKAYWKKYNSFSEKIKRKINRIKVYYKNKRLTKKVNNFLQQLENDPEML